MSVTLKQIAQASGLSIQAVSQALNQTGRLRPQTRARVLDAAHRLGYRPNAAARANRTGRFRQVALLESIDPRRGWRPNDLIDGIHDGLVDRQYHLTFAKLSDQTLSSEPHVPRLLRELMVDGLIVNYRHSIPPQLLKLIREHTVPAIWVGSKQQANCVYTDQAAATARAVTELVSRGHRRIAYVGWQPTSADAPGDAHYSRVGRHAGYCGAMRDAGLTPCVIEGVDDPRVMRRRLAETLRQPDRPTALLISQGALANAALFAAAVDVRLEVPVDLSLITLAGQPVRDSGVEITTLVNPHRQVGLSAAEMALRRIDEPGVDLPPRVLPFTWEAGQTCASPPRSS